jgi:putative peptidoglycan lipid II flippase
LSVTQKPNERTISAGRAAFLVGTGIFLSRLTGLIRERIFAHYFGNSAAADAFKAAFRIPNFLQNLFGEGVLSASFIPVYVGQLTRQNKEESGRLAGAIGAILALCTSLLVLVGIYATPFLIDLIAPGFEGSKRALAIKLVKIFFPGAGMLVLSAWCLGVLNSHRRFLVSYSAPVLWNLVIIAALLGFGGRMPQFPLAEVIAWSSVAGSALQFLVQLPLVIRLASPLRISLNWHLAGVQTIVRNFVPVFLSRGVVQISAYVDAFLASLLPTGALAALSYAQVLYTLPLSLFGMSVSAAELPAMSSAAGSDRDVARQLQTRLNSSLRRIAFLVVPSAMAFLALGDVVAGAVFQTGEFTRADATYLWGILAGSAVGLLASTLGRLYSSAFYALKDTRTPLRFAAWRVLLTTILGYFCALPLPPAIGLSPKWGVAGLTASAGLAGWLEFTLLRRSLNRRIGETGIALPILGKYWTAAVVAALFAWIVKFATVASSPLLIACGVLGTYGIIYLAASAVMGATESNDLIKRLAKYWIS